jgi:hypothetical protein
MRGIECFPKRCSTNVNFSVFFCPSIWECLDCDYESAFIIEDSRLAEKIQKHYRKRCNIIGWAKGEPCMDNWYGSTNDQQKPLENYAKSVATTVEGNNCMGLRL